MQRVAWTLRGPRLARAPQGEGLRAKRLSNLPLRGRVGAKLRGGVMRAAPLSKFSIPLAARVTPTRRFAATSPLKGEVGGGEGCVTASPLGERIAERSGGEVRGRIGEAS